MTLTMVVMAFCAGFVIGVWIMWNMMRERMCRVEDAAWMRGYEQARQEQRVSAGKEQR